MATKTLSVTEIQHRVSEIAAKAHDSEAAHGLEDQLYLDVLKAIASGRARSPKAAACAALVASRIDFHRWMA